MASTDLTASLAVVSPNFRKRGMFGMDNTTNWNELIAPASMSIAFMSQLLIARNRVPSFKINHIDKKKIPLIQDPESFRSTLFQVSEDCYEAFTKAHGNMLRIRYQTEQVPRHVKHCMEYLKSGDKKNMKNSIRRRLDRIKHAADDGAKLAKEVCDEFDLLGKLIRQVIQALMKSMDVKEDDIMDKIEKTMKSEEESEKKQRDKIENLKREISEAKKNVKEKKKYYDETRKTNNGFWILCFGLEPKEKSVLYAQEMKMEAENDLKKVEKEEEEVQKDLKRMLEEDGKALEKLQCQVKKDLDENEMLQILCGGLNYLYQCLSNWAKMKRCLDVIVAYFTCVTLPSYSDFLDESEEVEGNASEMLEESLQFLLESCYKTHLSATKYVQVCENYIKMSMNQMCTMLTLPSHEIIEAQIKLIASCAETIDSIEEMYKVDRAEVTRQTEKEIEDPSQVVALANVN